MLGVVNVKAFRKSLEKAFVRLAPTGTPIKSGAPAEMRRPKLALRAAPPAPSEPDEGTGRPGGVESVPLSALPEVPAAPRPVRRSPKPAKVPDEPATPPDPVESVSAPLVLEEAPDPPVSPPVEESEF